MLTTTTTIIYYKERKQRTIYDRDNCFIISVKQGLKCI